MRKALPVTLLTAAALAVPAAAGLPRAGTLVPGRSLGGVRLGETANAVRAALGSKFGVCNDCARTTWYFTYKPYDAHGLAVELVRRHVAAVYTLWQPEGWRATNGLRLGATPLQVHRLAGPLRTITCPGYEALTDDAVGSRTVYYLYNGNLWGFGLFLPHWSPCR
ncbi:MAG: hypothetical protein QOG85_245 [Gaiellaceae bacterium]|jgi:hypothetical protein|nr:hypothetical protein [Gaiellaceae bacterium]